MGPGGSLAREAVVAFAVMVRLDTRDEAPAHCTAWMRMRSSGVGFGLCWVLAVGGWVLGDVCDRDSADDSGECAWGGDGSGRVGCSFGGDDFLPWGG